jgi:acetyltransferase-like isoleucine patch superfamily enzyme
MWRTIYNPALEYAHYLFNKLVANARHRELRQHYLAFAVASRFEPNVTLFDRSLVVNCTIGSHSYVGRDSMIQHCNIGRYCAIGPGCRFGLGRHPSRGFVSSHPMFYSRARHTGVTFAERDYFEEFLPITIGNDVWAGANAIIVDGVTVGDGAIIGAGAVVSKPVPPYSVVGGVPAQILRNRFTDAQIAQLLRFRWWDRDEAWLRAHYRRFHDIEDFMALIAESCAT